MMVGKYGGVYPNTKDWSEHEKNIKNLKDETEQGQHWHLDHNEPEAADEHAKLKHHLLNALDLIDRIKQRGSAEMPDTHD